MKKRTSTYTKFLLMTSLLLSLAMIHCPDDGDSGGSSSSGGGDGDGDTDTPIGPIESNCRTYATSFTKTEGSEITNWTCELSGVDYTCQNDDSDPAPTLEVISYTKTYPSLAEFIKEGYLLSYRHISYTTELKGTTLEAGYDVEYSGDQPVRIAIKLNDTETGSGYDFLTFDDYARPTQGQSYGDDFDCDAFDMNITYDDTNHTLTTLFDCPSDPDADDVNTTTFDENGNQIAEVGLSGISNSQVDVTMTINSTETICE